MAISAMVIRLANWYGGKPVGIAAPSTSRIRQRPITGKDHARCTLR